MAADSPVSDAPLQVGVERKLKDVRNMQRDSLSLQSFRGQGFQQ